MLSDVKVKEGSLHKQLGYGEDTNLQEIASDELISRQKKQINSDKYSYKNIISKINWQRNISKDSAFSNKLTHILSELKKWNEKTTVNKESSIVNDLFI